MKTFVAESAFEHAWQALGENSDWSDVISEPLALTFDRTNPCPIQSRSYGLDHIARTNYLFRIYVSLNSREILLLITIEERETEILLNNLIQVELPLQAAA